MRKFTLFLMSLLLSVGAMAQESIDDFYQVNTTFSIYNGNNASKIVDGNLYTKFWSSEAQTVGKDVTVILNNAHAVGAIQWHFCDGDKPLGATIERKTTGGEWEKIADFVKDDIVNNTFICDAEGKEIKELRLRITQEHSNWLQIAEVQLYKPITEREISIEALGHGNVEIYGYDGTTIKTDAPVTIIATPENGYVFKCWKVGETEVSTSCKYEVRGSESATYTAVFVEVPAWSKKSYFIKSLGTEGYLTVKKYNVVTEEQSYQTGSKVEGSEDQIFIFEPAIEYNKYYIKSASGYYLNCESWNAYAQSEKTTPIFFEEVEDDVYTLYQATSSHKHGYLNIQTNHNNGLYCDAVSADNNYKKWSLEALADKERLEELIAEAEGLLEKVASRAIVEGARIDISGKITSNAAQNNADGNVGASDDGKGIAGLTDDDVNSYFHSRWGGKAIDEDHYLQIDLGDGNSLSEFCFSYSVRKGNDAGSTSPAPTEIEVRVSEDGSAFDDPIYVFTKDDNGLPSYTDLGNTLWHSGVISAGKNVRYIRLTVTGSEGPGNTVWEGHTFFAMSALNVYNTKLADKYSIVKEEYKDLVTVGDIEAASNATVTSKATISSLTATQSQVDEAKKVLNDALDVLRTATKSYTLSVGTAGWATLFLDFNAAIPADVEAYIVAGVKEGDWLNLVQVKVKDVLPENTGIIVKANAGDYTFKYAAVVTADVKGNLLAGSVEDTYVEGTAYVLANHKEAGIGMYKAVLNFDAEGNKVAEGETGTHFLNNANKAYLPMSATNGAAYYSFRFGEGTTGIEEVKTENGEVKAIFDLTGRRVEAITAPGIYIVNGKKVLVK